MTHEALIPSHEITQDEAVALVGTRWWVDKPHRDVALSQLHQSRLCMPFGDFHLACEKAAGCSIWTHEFAEPARIIAMIEGQGGRTESPVESLERLLTKDQP
jgi:hypothetical protein